MDILYCVGWRCHPTQYKISIILLAAAVLLAGCASLQDPEASQEQRSETIAVLEEGQVYGQSFVSRRPGLDGIQVWIQVDASAHPRGRLIAELFQTPGEKSPLSVLNLSFSEVAKSSPLRLAVGPQPGPAGQGYYLSLRVSEGKAYVYGRNEDAYPEGQTYAQGEPVEADMAFRLSYSYGLAAFSQDVQRALSDLWLLLPLGLTLLLPGWLLLDWSGLKARLDGGERIALSVGLSLSLVPVLMLWTSFFGLSWDRGAVWAAAGLMGIALLWRQVSPHRSSDPAVAGFVSGAFQRDLPETARVRLPFSLTGLALAAVFIFSLGIRLIMARDLAAPPWVDPVHHALITRLIVEQGAYPQSYSPYLDISTAGYHPGFHSVEAVFHWLSGLEVSQAMLLLGQVLNALSVFGVYLFTQRLTGSRTAGVIAALISGAFTPMPAYYTSWGRYTQLAGLLIFPAGLALVDENGENRAPQARAGRWRVLLLAGLACGGLFLTHYRVAAFLGALLLAILANRALFSAFHRFGPALEQKPVEYKARLDKLLHETGWLALAAATAVLLTLPWWRPTLQTLILPKSAAWSAGRLPPFSDFTWTYLTSALGLYTLILAGLGLLLGILLRRWFTLVLLLWVALLFIMANLSALRLPGGGFINHISVEISLFLPISALGGFFIARILAVLKVLLPERARKIAFSALGLLAVALACLGARHLVPILNPVTLLFREADRSGLSWIQENTPEEATVLVNPFAWGYGTYAGSDGGYWITPITGRRTMPPPVLYGFDSSTENVSRINEISQKAIDYSQDPQALHQLLATQDIRYVYLGSRGGVLSPRLLNDSGLFALRYARDGVWIFEVMEGE